MVAVTVVAAVVVIAAVTKVAKAVAAGCDVSQYSPNEVKLAVAGDGAADKVQVQAMVQRLLGLATPPKPAGAADAAALALCHLAHAPVRARQAAATARAGAGSAR